MHYFVLTSVHSLRGVTCHSHERHVRAMGLNPIIRVLYSVSLFSPPWHGATWRLRIISREGNHHGIAFHRRPLGVKPFDEVLDILPSFFVLVMHIPENSESIISSH